MPKTKKPRPFAVVVPVYFDGRANPEWEVLISGGVHLPGEWTYHYKRDAEEQAAKINATFEAAHKERCMACIDRTMKIWDAKDRLKPTAKRARRKP